MCKTRSITYDCTHIHVARLSTCHGSFTQPCKAGRTPKAACGSCATLSIRSRADCGDCQRTQAETVLNASLADTKDQHSVGALEISAAQNEHDTMLYRLSKAFPAASRTGKYVWPERGRTRTRATKAKGSILSMEVLPEDVVEKLEVAKGGEWDQEQWGSGWKTLGDELAETTENEPVWDCSMNASMNESNEEYLRAFDEAQDESEKDNGAESLDESGDAPWSSETDPWTNSSSWSKASPWPQAETEAAQPPATFVDTPLQLLTNQEREQQPSKDTFLLKSELPPNKQEPPASSKEFDSDREPAQKTSRRLEVDLLERFQCFQLPLLVLVRSR